MSGTLPTREEIAEVIYSEFMAGPYMPRPSPAWSEIQEEWKQEPDVAREPYYRSADALLARLRPAWEALISEGLFVVSERDALRARLATWEAPDAIIAKNIEIASVSDLDVKEMRAARLAEMNDALRADLRACAELLRTFVDVMTTTGWDQHVTFKNELKAARAALARPGVREALP